MTQTLNKREDPLNLGGGWSSSAPFRTWSSSHRRRRGAPTYRRRPRYGPNAAFEPRRKQPKQQHGQGPWFQPPRSPYRAVHSNRRRWGGPWRPPRAGCWKHPGRMQVIRVCGMHPLCLCCCSCWQEPWNPGWTRPPGRKKRWGRRGRGLRRHPRRSFPRNPPVDVSTLLRPVNLYGWRAPGMRAPRNTTQFIMNQVYEDMRQQEKQERQQEALRAQRAQAGGPASPAGSASGNDAQPAGGEEDAELPECLFSCVRNTSLSFSPVPQAENQSPAQQLVEKEERNDECEQEECDGKEEESEEEHEEAEAQDEEEVEESGSGEEEEEEEEEGEEEIEEEEGLEEDEQRGEENDLPLQIPLSFLVEAEEEGENFMNCSFFSPNQIIPEVPQEALLMDINF
ncbi:coiled-coil glutamate rich protein 1 [Rhinolophus ferrumequinum]|uniref:Coiled-coil glutamate rich protein 1 n=1 Tax=Rhinolophus ferrumequinum TaxID=59479 RepID=A0A671FU41_RHIFE|nr:coiled-coil glutamate rich protein 1 [Rhinolophus ferrumequinum]